MERLVSIPDRNARIPVKDIQFSCTSVTYVRHKISISDLVLHRTSVAHKISLNTNNKSDYDISM